MFNGARTNRPPEPSKASNAPDHPAHEAADWDRPPLCEEPKTTAAAYHLTFPVTLTKAATKRATRHRAPSA